MLKPSDFNNAVPQFQNGNYASNPINPQYVEEPSSTDYNRGAEPLQTLPAQWWNWFINKFTSRFNKVNIYVKNLFNELAQLLSLVNVTPDGTEGAVTDEQLKNAFKELYPDYINTKLALESTYVKKTQKVNNHALSGDITISKSDVGLGNVANTGDSANASSGGTTKFTTGGAYNLISSIAPYFSTSTAYAVGALITYQNKLYECTTAHSAGEWNASHFTARSIQYVISNYILPSLAPTFSTSTSYAVGDFVIYQNKLYRCKTIHSAGTWNTSHFELATLNNINTSLGTKADLLDLASAFSTSISYAVGDYVTYNGNLYRCTVAHSGAWNASHFTPVTVGSELIKKTDVTTFDDATNVTTHFNNAPYTGRVTDYDRASTNKIVGASFAINQLVKNGNFASTSGWSFDPGRATFSVSGNVGKMSDFQVTNPFIQQSRTFLNTHKYLGSIEARCNQSNGVIDFGLRNSVSAKISTVQLPLPTTSRQLVSAVFVADDTVTSYYIEFRKSGYDSSTEVTFSNANLIDLTQMFGSAIADRIYAMEQATEGSGVAWIKSFGFFNNAYYETDEGSLQSVKPSAHKVSASVVKWFTSRNVSSQYLASLYAEAVLKPNTNYTLYLRGANGARVYPNEYIFTTNSSFTLDGSLQSITVKTKTELPYASSNRYENCWIILKNAQGNTIVPNFTEFYIVEEGVNVDHSFSQSIPLADTELRGIPKLDSSNNLYFDGDVYYPNGDVIRKYGVVDLGSLTWGRDTATEGTVTGRFVSAGISANAIPQSINSIMSNGFSVKAGSSAMQDKCYRIDNSKNVVITDTAYTDAATFKTAMNGVYLIYELATPTSEKVAGYTNPHTLVKKGMEEFVDTRTVPVPTGHETTYLSLPDWLSATDPFAIGIDGASPVPAENGSQPFSTGGAYTELAKKVDKTTKVNGHALSGNVTVTKGDVGLGSVENTGDSAVPAENGTDKFTTGGAYDFFGGNTDASAWLGRVFGWALGRNWTQVSDLNNVRKIFYLNKMWFVFSDTLGILWSVDGKAWTAGTGYDTDIYFSNMSYGNGVWIACTSNKKLYWSSNGKSWNLCTLSGTITSQTTDFYQASYGNGIWVAASFYDGLWWSTDGKSWTQVTGNTSTYIFYSVKYADGIFVAGSNSHGLWWSTDGKNWTQSSDYTDSSIRYVFYANGIWYASATLTDTLYYSEDGKNWSTVTVSDAINCLCYANGTWYFGGDDDCYYSLDGHTLTSMNVYFRRTSEIVYANTVMLAFSVDSGLYLSTDYRTFTSVMSWDSTRDGGVAYGDGMFCASVLSRGIFVSDYTNADIQ